MAKRKKLQVQLDVLSEDELLETRICDLPISIKNTWLEDCILKLYKELDEKAVLFKPECYLADEWLTPENETCIGIPFYLAHPQLIKLEKKIMIDAEGEGNDWCMKLLRHEAGHALCYAFNFHKRKKWQKIFGPATIEYKDTFKYHPYSKNYVRHLDGYYAQYHPEEDFVETFAVWLTPKSDWRTKYKGWKALKKLEYVDQLMKEVQNKLPRIRTSMKHWRVSTLRMKLKTYYKKKRQQLAEEFPDFHDGFLNETFSVSDDKTCSKATEVIKKYKKLVQDGVSSYSGERKYIVNDVIKDIQKRAKERNLKVMLDESQVVLNMTSYVTALIMNYSYTGKFRGEKKRLK